MSYCYILYSGTNTYIGATVDPDRRLRQHNAEITGGARRTKGREWKRALYVSGFPDWKATLQFEWSWKRHGRGKPGLRGKLQALFNLIHSAASTSKAVPFSQWTEKIRIHPQPDSIQMLEKIEPFRSLSGFCAFLSNSFLPPFPSFPTLPSLPSVSFPFFPSEMSAVAAPAFSAFSAAYAVPADMPPPIVDESVAALAREFAELKMMFTDLKATQSEMLARLEIVATFGPEPPAPAPAPAPALAPAVAPKAPKSQKSQKPRAKKGTATNADADAGAGAGASAADESESSAAEEPKPVKAAKAPKAAKESKASKAAKPEKEPKEKKPKVECVAAAEGVLRFNLTTGAAPLKELSNYFNAEITIDSVTYRTVAAYIQSERYIADAPEYAQKIRDTPNSALIRGYAKKTEGARADWDAVKADVQLKGMRAKFEAHPALRTILLGTGDAPLEFAAIDDSVWGIGAAGNGENLTGKALMTLRAEFRAAA